MQTLGGDVVVEIDGEIEALIAEINTAPSEGRQQEFIGSLQTVVVDSLLGPFGLSRTMLAEQDGGNITTVHNFKKGVTANSTDAERHRDWRQAQSQKFDRSDYQKPLPAERKKLFKEDGPIIDGYTGTELPRDGRAHRDHVVSAHEIETSAKGHLAQTREERIATANLEQNKTWTNEGLNSSKQEKDLGEWRKLPNAKDSSKTNEEYYGLDPALADETYRTARETVDRKQNRSVFTKQAGEFIHQGSVAAGKLALRQVMGLIIADLAGGVIQDIRVVARNGLRSGRELTAVLRNRLEQTKARVLEKWADYLKEGASAGLSGFVSTLLTLLINSLVTTARNVVTIIREGTLATVRSIKAIVMPEPGMTGADIAYEVTRIMSGAMVLAIGLTLEEGLRKAIEAVPILAPFAGPLAQVVTGVGTGVATLLVILAFDRLKSHIAFRNKEMADLHRGHNVTLLRIKRTAVVIDQAAAHVTRKSEQMFAAVAEGGKELAAASARTDTMLDDYDAAVRRLASIELDA